jgi:voltage-gated potassium channel
MGRARRPGWRRRLLSVVSPVWLPIGLLAFALVYGTAGYVVIEGFGVLDAVYMCVTTLTTVGFGEIHPLTPAGRAFTLSLIAIGVLAVFALIAVLTSLLASGQLGQLLARRGMRRQIDNLRDHFVICAYGRVGRAAADELTEQGADVVVIEIDPNLEQDMLEAGLPYLVDDPSDESVLDAAGVRRAQALLCAVDSDEINVYITLTARAMNPDLFIIARAARPESIEILRRAGADRVVSPYTISGARMASLALRPAVLEFVDMVSVAPDLRIEELVVGDGSRLASCSVREVCAPYEGVMILAVRQPSGDTLVPPRADTVLSAGDVLIVVGPVKALAQLAEGAA